MSQFFIAVLIIFFGGLWALILARQARLMKVLAVLLLGAGCAVGLADSITKLLGTGAFNASFDFLKSFSLAFQIDGLSAFFLAVIFFVSLVASIYSYHYMDAEKQPVRAAANYFFFSLLIASMALVVTAANIITFILSWEIMSLSSFFLVIYHYEARENRRAGYLYFIFSHVGAMFIFAAFALVYGVTHSFEFSGMAQLPGTIKYLVFAFTFVGFGSKAGVFPFHVWLPHAHPAAPSHISAVMSGVMIKTGIYGILRVYTLLDFTTPVFGYVLIGAGVLSGVLGVVYALGQQDIKRMLAYSSVENIGVILIGLGIGMVGVTSKIPVMAVLGFAGAFLHILNHAIFKSLLFMGAGMVLHSTGTRSIDALGGLLKHMKVTGIAFIIGSLAISGLPPFNGFVSEFFIYTGAFKGMVLGKTDLVMGIIAIIGLAVIGGLALACFTRVIGIVFQGEPRTAAAENVGEHGATMLVSMAMLAGACLLIGVYPALVMSLPMKAVAAMGLDTGSIPAAASRITGNITLAAALFLTLLVIVVLVRALLYKGKTIGSHGTWGCGFTQPTVKMQYTGTSFAGSILEFFSAAAPVTEDHPPIRGRFPEKTHYKSQVHDIAEVYMDRGIVRPILAFFDKLRWIQHGDIHLYIGYILLAIVLLLFFV